MTIKKKLELLSPAKNLECGTAAINCGADAVYIGAPKFGARASAGNDLKDIETLVQYAHKYWAKVYVTINTILYDDEINEAKALIDQLYNMGVDAIIIQDTGLLELDLPQIPLFASTQMHNNTPEKIKFLEETGIQRVILARELSLSQISAIKQITNIDLEYFIHGALCVSYSGQCYFSQALFKRSGNRGECAQPCRMLYSLEDSTGKVLVKDKYLLSLKDLNLSSYLKDLINAGVTSFKIEGRLKDVNYVKNITAYYRQQLDKIIEQDNSLAKASSGKTYLPFTPDPERTFNRGYTDYFITGRKKNLSSLETQKSLGKLAGAVEAVYKNYFLLTGKEKLNNGDGICYIGKSGTLLGMNIIRVEENKIFVQDTTELIRGAEIFRNRENEFNRDLNKKGLKRQIDVTFTLCERYEELYLECRCEDGITSEIKLGKFDIAEDQDSSRNTIVKQLLKSGDTIFNVKEIKIRLSQLYFIPINIINDFRRNLLNNLEEQRVKNYPQIFRKIGKNNFPFPQKEFDYRGNVVNKMAFNFYNRHHAEVKEDGFEKLNNHTGKAVMKCKYCIKDQLNLCPKYNHSKQEQTFTDPLYLVDKHKKYLLKFDCKNCEMSIIY